MDGLLSKSCLIIAELFIKKVGNLNFRQNALLLTHDTDKVERCLTVPFFGLVFSVALPWKCFCRHPCREVSAVLLRDTAGYIQCNFAEINRYLRY